MVNSVLPKGEGPLPTRVVRQLEELGGGGLGDGLGQLLGFGFLGGVECFLHGGVSHRGGGFFTATSRLRLVYKNSTKFRDAHTRKPTRTRRFSLAFRAAALL